jgi:hypothetical protein
MSQSETEMMRIVDNIENHRYPDSGCVEEKYRDSFGIQFHLRDTDDLNIYSVNKLLHKTVIELKTHLSGLDEGDDIPQFVLDCKKGMWLLDIYFECQDGFNLIIKLRYQEVEALLTNLINSGVELWNVNGRIL